MGLTPKQEKFCNTYIETGNASEAYRSAYNCSKMKPETINRKAKELLDNGKITARITDLQDELKEISDIKKERLLYELKALLEATAFDFLEFDLNNEVIEFDENRASYLSCLSPSSYHEE